MSDSPLQRATLDEVVAGLVEDARGEESEVIELATTAHDVYMRGAVDFNFFAALVAPTVMRTLFPPFYLQLFQLLTRDLQDPYAILRFALGLPRGFAKTTFLKIIVCWLICYHRNSYFMIVCATDKKATRFIKDVKSMLGQPVIRDVYGNWGEAKLVDNSFLLHASIGGHTFLLEPAGAESAIRGANIDLMRPDCLIFDDVQSREDALSDVVNQSQREWFYATALKAIETYGANRRVIFLGNMYPGDCLLQNLVNNPEWISLVTGAILDDGESLWPELKPVRALIAEYKHDANAGLGHIWFAEVQNDPLDERYKLLGEPIPEATIPFDIVEPDITFLTVDPAGFRKRSDDNVITAHGIYENWQPVALEFSGGVWNPKETVEKIFEMADKYKVSVVGIESVGYQQSLLYWVDYFKKEVSGHINFEVVELKTGNRSKLMRIRDYISELLSGQSQMTKEVAAVFSYYAHRYKLGSTTNRDDYLDCPAYQKQVMTEYRDKLRPINNNLLNEPHVGVVEQDYGY